MVMVSGNVDTSLDSFELTFVVKDDGVVVDRTSLASVLCSYMFDWLLRVKASDDAFSEWRQGRFRKLLKRAKPALFERICSDVEGVERVKHGDVEFAVVPLTRKSKVHPLVRKCQVQGLKVSVDEGYNLPRMCVFSRKRYLVIHVNDELGMSSSKGIIAACHVVQLVWEKLQSEGLRSGLLQSAMLGMFDIQVVWKRELISGNNFVEVFDAGLTEVEAGSMTAVGNIL